MKMYLNEREVVDIEIDGIDTKDFPDFVDAYAKSAEWGDTGLPLTEEELNQLTEDSDFHALVLDRIH